MSQLTTYIPREELDLRIQIMSMISRVQKQRVQQEIDLFLKWDTRMVATLVTHPLDLLKIRRQISSRRCGTFKIARQIYKSEGLKTFYCGLTAGLMRQATNIATRLAVYEILCDRYTGTYNEVPSSHTKMLIGIISSMAGGLVGCPSEMVLVRRMAEGCHFSTPSGRCKCDGVAKGTLDSLRKIIREEGFVGLMRGWNLTLLRTVMVSTIHIGCEEYLMIPARLKQYQVTNNEHTLAICSLVLTHLISALLTHPVDLLKSFYQLSKNKNDTQISIMKHLLRTRGFFGLLRGFPPYFIRMTSHALVKFLVLERI